MANFISEQHNYVKWDLCFLKSKSKELLWLDFIEVLSKIVKTLAVAEAGGRGEKKD